MVFFLTTKEATLHITKSRARQANKKAGKKYYPQPVTVEKDKEGEEGLKNKKRREKKSS